MADITTTKTLSANKGGMSVTSTHSENITMTGDDMISSTQVIGTTWEALSFGEITGVPIALQVVNLDATNFVQLAIANDNSGVYEKLLAGHSYQGHPAAATIYAKADTAACRVKITAIEV